MRELNLAFEILGNSGRREEYNRRHPAPASLEDALAAAGEAVSSADGAGASREPFFLRRNDPRSRARLILHHLLEQRPGEAVGILEEMETRLGGQFLEDHLEARDLLDCLFLLGEHYLSRRAYAKAAQQLERFCHCEAVTREPRHYRDEALRILKDLYLKKLPRTRSWEAAIQGLKAAAQLRLTPSEEQGRLLMTVRVHMSASRWKDALEVLDEAERRFPEASRVKRLRTQVLTSRAAHAKTHATRCCGARS